MDFISEYHPLLIITVVILVIAFAAATFNFFYPEIWARFRIYKDTKLYLYNHHYQIIENIEIISASGERIKIKQLLASRYGLFILETCHYRGTIYGSHHQVKWLSKGIGYAKVFRNPHMENQTTRNLLAEHLHLCPTVCKTILVFTGNSRFPSSEPADTCKNHNFISTICKHRELLINPNLLPDLISVLKCKKRNNQNIFKDIRNTPLPLKE